MLRSKSLFTFALSIALTGQIIGGATVLAQTTGTDNPAPQASDNTTQQMQQASTELPDLQQLTDQHILKPYSDHQLHPDAWVTKSDLKSALKKSLGLSEGQLKKYQGYQNISNAQPNQNAQAGSDKYHPADALNRSDVIALFGEMYGNLPDSQQTDQILGRFTDQDQVPATERPAVARAVQSNLTAFNGAPDNTNATQLAPAAPATRGDLAIILNHFLGVKESATNLPQTGKMKTAPQTASSSSATTQQTSENTTESSKGIGGQAGAAANASENNATSTTTSSSSTDNLSASGTSSVNPSSSTYSSTSSQTQTTTTTETPATVGTASGNTVVVPAQTILTGTVANSLYSNFNRKGDKVTVILDHPITTADGSLAVPAGSRITGVVQGVHRYYPVAPAKPGMIDVHFTQIETPAHVVIPISATIATPDGKLYGDSTTGLLTQPNCSTKDIEGRLQALKEGLPDDQLGRMYLFHASELDTPKRMVDKQEKQVVVGVGDIMQVRLDQPLSVNVAEIVPSSTAPQAAPQTTMPESTTPQAAPQTTMPETTTPGGSTSPETSTPGTSNPTPQGQ